MITTAVCQRDEPGQTPLSVTNFSFSKRSVRVGKITRILLSIRTFTFGIMCYCVCVCVLGGCQRVKASLCVK